MKGLATGSISELPQTDSTEALKHAPKIFKEDTRIDWLRPVIAIQNFIRGMSPYPAAFTSLGDKTIKIYKSHYSKEQPDKQPGVYDTDGKSYLRIAAQDGWLYIDELQHEGKKRMDIVAFLRGFRA